jgi:hypothetical protein
MLRSATCRAPNSPLNQVLQLPALLLNFSKQKTLKVSGDPVDLDSARHARRQLIAIAEELVTSKVEHQSKYIIMLGRWSKLTLQDRTR